jgi:hypothetical protein
VNILIKFVVVSIYCNYFAVQAQLSIHGGDVNMWDEQDVCHWLATIRLNMSSQEMSVLHSVIQENHINGGRLLMLTDSDLINMGMVVSCSCI